MCRVIALLTLLASMTWSSPVSAQVSPSALTLTEAVAMARENDAALRATFGSVETTLENAAGLSRAARAFPALSIGTAFSTEPEAAAPLKTIARGVLNLDFGAIGSRSAALRLARAQVAQSQASLMTQRRGAMQSVLDAFFAVALDQARAEQLGQSARLVSDGLDAAKTRYRVGTAPLLDVFREQSALASAQADYQAAITSLRADRNRLTLLLGAPVNVVDSSARITLPSIEATTAAALQTNPALLATVANVDAQRAALASLRANLGPAFSIGGGIALTREGGEQSVGPAFDVSLAQPLPSSVPRANMAAAESALAIAKSAVVQARSKALQDVLSLRGQAAAELSRLPRLQMAFDDAHRVARATLAAYRLRAVSSTDLFVAQSRLSATASALTTARVAAAQSYANLQLQMGAFNR